MRQLAESARVGHLGTISADGQPHVVPVCFVLVGETAYSAVDQKPKRTTQLRRIANVTATGHACLLVDQYSEDWTALWWVRADGVARVLAPEDEEAVRAVDRLVARYAQYREARPHGPVLAVDVDRWSGWSAG